MASQFPVIAAWYLDVMENQVFEVVAIDEQFGTVEIQYLGGELSEFDLDTWSQLQLLPAAAPEDAGAAYEMSIDDDLNLDNVLVPHNWNNPTQSLEPDNYPSIEDF